MQAASRSRSAGNVVLLLASLGLVLISGPARADGPAVLVARATTVSFPLSVEALGTARANEAIDVRPQVSEVITAIHFAEGQDVEAGAVLVELENTEALADVAAARANLVDFQNQVRRARELFDTRAVAASELDQRVAQRDAARAALAAAESRLSDSKVRAPFAGKVGLRRVSMGSLVTPSTIITTLDDTDTIKLDFDVPETAIARLEEGLSVEAHSAAYPDHLFRGKVASIDTRVDPVSRTVTVRSLVPNSEGRLRPGMFLTVALLRDDVTALVVPEQAIVPEQSRQYVLVVGPEGQVSKREIRTGRRRPGHVEVVEGLAEGEVVIAEGTQKARIGEPVEVVGEVPVEPQTAATVR
jgi:membrane fusion protein (multidrug efflux system)